MYVEAVDEISAQAQIEEDEDLIGGMDSSHLESIEVLKVMPWEDYLQRDKEADKYPISYKPPKWLLHKDGSIHQVDRETEKRYFEGTNYYHKWNGNLYDTKADAEAAAKERQFN